MLYGAEDGSCNIMPTKWKTSMILVQPSSFLLIYPDMTEQNMKQVKFEGHDIYHIFYLFQMVLMYKSKVSRVLLAVIDFHKEKKSDF